MDRGMFKFMQRSISAGSEFHAPCPSKPRARTYGRPFRSGPDRVRIAIMLQEQTLTTFQLVLYSVLHAITEILPLSGNFHLEAMSRLTG